MAGIAQIQLRYMPVADRLLLRISTTANAEFRFWVTRRLTRLLWPALVKQLATIPAVEFASTSDARREILAFEHARAIEGANFVTPFQTTAQVLPLGEEPLLISKVTLRAAEPNGKQLSIVTDRGVTLDLTLTQALGHSLCELLGRAVATTEWDLASPLPTSRHELSTQSMN